MRRKAVPVFAGRRRKQCGKSGGRRDKAQIFAAAADDNQPSASPFGGKFSPGGVPEARRRQPDSRSPRGEFRQRGSQA